MKPLLTGIAVVIGLGLMVWLIPPHPVTSSEVAGDRPSGAPAAGTESPIPAGKDGGAAVPPGEDAGPAPDRQPHSTLEPAAISALRETRAGDPRAPEIGTDPRAESRRQGPPPADYRDYLSAQHEQQRRRHAAYVYAAGEKLREMDEQLEWGRSNGVSPGQLEMAREKRERLADARRRLLEEDPALESDFPEPDPLNPPTR